MPHEDGVHKTDAFVEQLVFIEQLIDNNSDDTALSCVAVPMKSASDLSRFSWSPFCSRAT